MKFYDFSKGAYEDELFPAYSPQSKASDTFTVESGYICNKLMPVPEGKKINMGDYEYISLLTKDKYHEGDIFTTECDFDDYGAPLMVFTNELKTINGKPSYDRHIEVVAFEEGYNVWDIVYAPDRPERNYIYPKKIAIGRFPIAGRERVTITCSVNDGVLSVCVNGHEGKVEIPDFPKEFHVGITACENINRFYNLKIETK